MLRGTLVNACSLVVASAAVILAAGNSLVDLVVVIVRGASEVGYESSR